MGSSFKLKNGQDQEFSIVHNDNAGAISVASDKIVVKDSNGNVGIGTNSPTLTEAADKALHIHANTEGQLHLTTANTGSTSNDGSVVSVASNNNLYLWNKENANVIIATNNAERVTIDPNGQLFVGNGNANQGMSVGRGTKRLVMSYDVANSKAIINSSDFGTIQTPLSIQGYELSFCTGIYGTLERMKIDNNGNLLLTSGTGGIGYGTGAGGTVTQATSKSTAVTLNKPTGRITMSNAALAANTAITFQFTNSLISVSDTVLIHLREYGGNTEPYIVTATTLNVGGGAFITLINRGAVSLSEAVQLEFSIIKGANA